jgi:hypothetical protein
MEAHYGVFEPPQNKKNDISTKVILRDLPGGRSRYQYDTLNLETEEGRAREANYFGDVVRAVANRNSGGRMVSVDMQLAERRSSCSVMVGLYLSASPPGGQLH